MKRTLKRSAMGAVAALMLVAPIAAMPSYASAATAFQQGMQFDRGDRNARDDHGNWRNDDKRWHDHSWRKGERLPQNYRSHYREVNYRSYHLKAPPRGYHYVRDDRGETLLVGIATGAILGVILSNN
jgi:Ni/Co efflux regulator RcnB